jgi:hypothetical protein
MSRAGRARRGKASDDCKARNFDEAPGPWNECEREFVSSHSILTDARRRRLTKAFAPSRIRTSHIRFSYDRSVTFRSRWCVRCSVCL